MPDDRISRPPTSTGRTLLKANGTELIPKRWQDPKEITAGPALYIYGTGAFAQKAYHIIARRRKDIHVIGFLDTYKSGTLLGLPIHRFDQWAAESKAKEPLIILVASQFHQEILPNLTKLSAAQIGVLEEDFLLSAPRKWAKRIKKRIERANKFQFWYERQIAPLIARFFWWPYWPFYAALKRARVRFMCNIAHGTGHITRDLDDFLLAKDVEPNCPSIRWVWITPYHQSYALYMDLFRKEFSFCRASNLLYNIIAPILMRFRDIALDAGSAQIKWQLDERNRSNPPFADQTALNLAPLNAVTRKWIDSYRRHQKYPSLSPLKRANWSTAGHLPKALDPDRKTALIHIKDRIANATALATDPASYLPSLEHLEAQGYQLIFVGREKMPRLFRDRFDILDYASSPDATLANDLYLFSKADLAIVSGGIACLASAMGTPFVYVNSWHIAKFWWPRLNVVAPTLLMDGERPIPARVQQDLHDQLESSQTYSYDHLAPRNASAEEILEAVRELERLRDCFSQESDLQSAAKRLFRDDLVTHSSGRFSEYFLKQHEDAFFGRTASKPNSRDAKVAKQD